MKFRKKKLLSSFYDISSSRKRKILKQGEGEGEESLLVTVLKLFNERQIKEYANILYVNRESLRLKTEHKKLNVFRIYMSRC